MVRPKGPKILSFFFAFCLTHPGFSLLTQSQMDSVNGRIFLDNGKTKNKSDSMALLKNRFPEHSRLPRLYYIIYPTDMGIVCLGHTQLGRLQRLKFTGCGSREINFRSIQQDSWLWKIYTVPSGKHTKSY